MAKPRAPLQFAGRKPLRIYLAFMNIFIHAAQRSASVQITGSDAVVIAYSAIVYCTLASSSGRFFANITAGEKSARGRG